jgi:type II secretory pathway component PulF
MSDTPGRNGTGARLSGAESAELSGRLAELARAGLPLAPSLSALAEELPQGRLRRSMKALSSRLESGVSLAEAMEGQEGQIPEHLRGLVIAGVRTGRLGEVLGQFSNYVNIGVELKRRLWLSLAYPMLSLAVAVILFTFVSVYLVSQFELIFKDFGVPLPRLTIAVIEVARAIRAVWVALAILAAAMVAFWLAGPLLLRPALTRSLASRIPIAGGVWRWTSLAEFCHLLGLLLEYDLPLPEALRLTGEGVPDANIAISCRRMAGAVESGQTLAQAMADRWPFPAGLPRLVDWAEKQRTLPEVLHMGGEMFEARAGAHASFTGTVVGVLSVIMILWGLFTVVVGLMLPLITLISRLSG